ncbi:hypothetical protein GPJ56_004717 [Histomonas meleagridis]|uniref:uncharacterized protein n=1 Tax=Histomonas meleagridis TaxID=135588 RepID=UPI00355A6BAF|nr:hypothetical protein GPJ56_004717 [Histomonas meleagridis]KAH0799540.1 hypothetical protein GO595_007608 [Histomonas meleagridis]
MLVQILLLLDIANVQIPEFDIKHFITSISNLLQYYLNLTNKSHFHLQQNLLESSLLLILILNAEITEKQTVDFINTYLQTKSDDFTTDSQPLIITLIFNILRLATTNDSSTNTINIPLILSALHLIDIEPNSIYTPIILYVIAWIVSFPSLTIGLNDPCTFFSCKTPIHRGTYSDALIEIVSRLGIQRYKLVSLIISYVIPYSTNLSYSSAVNIFKAINISLEANDKETTKMLISAIHFMINQSVRDNVPTVIVMLKNSNILIKAMKENKDCEECQQVVQFIKSINQELKQIGKAFSSSELELFFQDPNCEHFAIPVLRPPQIEFDFNVEFGKYLKLLLAMYVTNNILKK